MKNVLSFFVISLLLFSCNDGDIITESLEFGDVYSTCGEIVFYKIKSDPGETLSYQIVSPTTTLESFFETVVDPTNPLLVNLVNNETISFDINGTNKFNYRTYNGVPTGNLFCNDVPPSGVDITNDNEATGGTAMFSVVLLEDDNDGIPASVEDENIDGDNDPATNPTDTDMDGLPDYLDDDDDGDNVKTVTEQPNYDETNGLALALDTDMDGTPNYLDTDDDNDLVLTINEENESQNQNPADDITFTNLGPDYLTDMVSTSVIASAYSSHQIRQTFTLELIITNLVLPILNQDVLDFGRLNATSSRTITPSF